MFPGRSSFRMLIRLSIGALIALACVTGVYFEELKRVVQVGTLFDEDLIVDNFRTMDRVFRTRSVKSALPTHQFTYSLRDLPVTYEYGGQKYPLADFLTRSWTTGLVVLRHGDIVYENYYLGNTESTSSISWSVAKSFVSALVGIAVEEGLIKDINQPVTDYVIELKGSGYDGVSIKNILQMSSGIAFNEDYGDFDSDINRMGRALALDTSMSNFVKSLERERMPGTYHHYVSMDTQVLGMMIQAVTGVSLASYLESRIWQPLGMESDAYWLTDVKGVELAFGGLNAVLRDYARFGQLYLQNGNWNGRQIIPAQWIKDSVTPDGPHLEPGFCNCQSSSPFGYGFQWWIPPDPEGDYLAIGIYNQFIYIHPKYGVVIAKTSTFPDYNKDRNGSELETVAVFRAIARNLSE